jgi:guanosine-3',5'-bis(diphosphate) 3'-pyrophosphohydrolase
MEFSSFHKDLQQNTDFNLSRIESAYKLAKEVHQHQCRKTGEPFITHPLAVAHLLYTVGGGENIICAGLLHDVLEECDVSDRPHIEEHIHQEFGTDVFFLVQAVTKDDQIENGEERQQQYCQQIEEAFGLDISVFFLKMADLLHNAKTIGGLNPHKQTKWIEEFKRCYIPMMSENFHKVCFCYHDMYLSLMNEAEKMIEDYEEKKRTKKDA